MQVHETVMLVEASACKARISMFASLDTAALSNASKNDIPAIRGVRRGVRDKF